VFVELDVFSGRPNPRWEPDEPDAEALRGLLSQLPVTTERSPEPPGLGYRGFLITDTSGQSRAYSGYVVRSDLILADPSSSVERFLLDRLPPEFQNFRPRITLET